MTKHADIMNDLSVEIHAENVEAGWWEPWPNKVDRHRTAMVLVFSELIEAMEGFRKDLMDDHLPEYKMFDVEMADAMIRLLDMVGAYQFEISGGDDFNAMLDKGTEKCKDSSVPEIIYQSIFEMCRVEDISSEVMAGIMFVLMMCKVYDVDIWKLVALKRAYNAKRADHKKENRAKEGGKKF